MEPIKTFIMNCVTCNAQVERAKMVKKPTCFTCKVKRKSDYYHVYNETRAIKKRAKLKYVED